MIKKEGDFLQWVFKWTHHYDGVGGTLYEEDALERLITDKNMKFLR